MKKRFRCPKIEGVVEHDYGFTKGLNILIGKARKRWKCIRCGFEEREDKI